MFLKSLILKKTVYGINNIAMIFQDLLCLYFHESHKNNHCVINIGIFYDFLFVTITIPSKMNENYHQVNKNSMLASNALIEYNRSRK